MTSEGVTRRFALALRDDFLKEVETALAAVAGDLGHAAKLRFTHAEMIIPLVLAMGLPKVLALLPASDS